MTVIYADSLAFRYQANKPVLHQVAFEVAAGQTLGLLGENGAGKSTLLGLISGRLAVQSGRLTLWGMDYARQRHEILKRIALVPQGYAFYPALTVAENVQFFAKLRTDLTDWRQRVEEALGFCQLDDWRAHRAQSLSGGLKRRLNLAIGLVNRPALLLLDEPTVGIDPVSKAFILQAIAALKQQGMTLVYTSHQMDEIDLLCDRVAILHQGRRLFHGELSALRAAQGLSLRAAVAFDSPPSEAWTNWLRRQGLQYCSPWVTGKVALAASLFMADFQQQVACCGGRVERFCLAPATMESAFFELLAQAREVDDA